MYTREIRIAMIGHVDHGKSTLLGQILFMVGGWANERIDEMRAAAAKRGRPVDFAMFTDALSEERDGQMTWDASQAVLCMDAVSLTLIDTPGHEELIGNMISGAGMAHAALIVVDVAEETFEKSLLHVDIVRILGINQVVVAVNKMDLVGYKESSFAAINAEIYAALRKAEIFPMYVVPVSAIERENVVTKSPRMNWYKGPHLLAALESVPPLVPPDKGAVCFPIQQVWEFEGRHVYMGRLESGTLQVGQKIAVMPSGIEQEIELIRSGASYKQQTTSGESIGVILKGDPRLERGRVLCDPFGSLKPASNLICDVACLSSEGLRTGEKLHARMGPQETKCIVRCTWIGARREKYGIETVERAGWSSICTMTVELDSPLVVDPTGRIGVLSRTAFYNKSQICALGRIRRNEGNLSA